MKMRAMCAAAAVVCAGASWATPIVIGNGQSVSLGDILNNPMGPQFIVGDKLFTIRDFDPSFPMDPAYASFLPQNIQVLGLDFGAAGRGFRLTGEWADPLAGDGIAAGFTLSYKVEILPEFIAQGWRITDNRLIFNGDAAGLGSFAKVDESVLDGMTGALIGEKEVFSRGDGSEQLQDMLLFPLPGYTCLEVVKDFELFAVAGGLANTSFIDQTWSQTQIIPLPTAGVAGGAMLAGLAAFRRRRA